MNGVLIALVVLLLVVCVILGTRRPWAAFWISPFACVGIMAMGGIQEEPALITLGPAILLVIWLSILLAPHDPDADLSAKRVVKGLLTTAGLLVLAVAVAILFGPLGAPMFLLVLLVACTLLACGVTARRAWAAVVFSTLSAIMRQNLPLAMALESAAAGRDDGAGYVMRQIGRWLVRGHSLSEAIRLGYPRCPAHAYGMIVAAERMGQLPTALGIIERDLHAKAGRRLAFNPLYPVYPVALMTVVVLLVSALMRFVIPQFRSVLTEMVGAPLPRPTQILIAIHYAVGEWLAPVVLAGLLCGGVILILRWWRPRRTDRPGILSRAGDFLTWHVPILHWFQHNQAMVETIAGLRMSLAAGCAVDQAIANLVPLDVNACFKRRLGRWLAAVQQGQDVAAAAVANRVGSSLAWAFDGRVNRGNAPAVLEMLESFYRSNYSYRVNLARFILWPGVTLGMAAVVGFVAFAVFSSIMATIGACMNYLP
jgi:type II secretory pathway component PulF